MFVIVYVVMFRSVNCNDEVGGALRDKGLGHNPHLMLPQGAMPT